MNAAFASVNHRIHYDGARDGLSDKQHTEQIAQEESTSGNFIPVEHAGSAREKQDEQHEQDSYETAQRYKFGYKIIDKYGNKQVREEEADEYNNRKGYYSFIDHDGVHRKVDYVADGHGFRATVVTNEPGTSHSNPAEAKIIANFPEQTASQYDGGIRAGHHVTPVFGKESSFFVPQVAAVKNVGAVPHRASIAHIPHAATPIAAPGYEEAPASRIVHSASAVRVLNVSNPRSVIKIVPSYASQGLHLAPHSHLKTPIPLQAAAATRRR